MTRPKPLFIMGNKRSGSTLMTDLLNSHANVFVSHESDIAWILYQARDGGPARYETHPLDSRLMLDSTLKSCRRILKETLSGEPTHAEIVEAFYRAQDRLLGQYLKPSFKQRLKRAAKIIGKRPTPARAARLQARPGTPSQERPRLDGRQEARPTSRPGRPAVPSDALPRGALHTRHQAPAKRRGEHDGGGPALEREAGVF